MTKNTEKLSSIIVEAMEKQGVSIGQLSTETDIPENFIKLLIENKIDELPARPYTHGYVVKICKRLNLNGEKLWEEFLADSEHLHASGENDKLPENRFSISNVNKRAILVGVLVVGLIGYFAFRALSSTNLSSELTLSNLQGDTTVVNTSEFTVKGKIDSRYQLTLNQTPVYPTNSGEFETTVNLEPGLNTLEFDITSFLGKEDSITKRVIYKQSTTTASEKEATTTSPDDTQNLNQQF